MSSSERMLDVLKAEVMGNVRANAIAHLLSIISICAGVGLSAYALYWRFPAYLPSPSQDAEWKVREELISLLLDATNMLMAATHFVLEPPSSLATSHEDSRKCLCLAMGKMSAALYWKVSSRFRCSFSSRVRKQLTRSFWRFTTLFSQIGLHPYKQLLIGEAGQHLTMEKLSEYIHDIAQKELSSVTENKKILEEIRDECEILLKVLDPSKTRWSPVEEIRRNCKPIEEVKSVTEEVKGVSRIQKWIWGIFQKKSLD